MLQALHSMLERELWKKLPMIPGGLPSLTDAVEGPHSPPGPGQIAAAPGTPQLSSSSAFEQWAAQGNPWRAGPGQRCVHTMLGLARGAVMWQGKGSPCSLQEPCPEASCIVYRAVGLADWRCPAELPLIKALLSTAFACQLFA